MHAFQLKGIINFMTLNEIDTNSDESLKTRYATWGRNVASLYSGGNFNNSELIVVFHLTSKHSHSVTTTVLLYAVWQFMSYSIKHNKHSVHCKWRGWRPIAIYWDVIILQGWAYEKLSKVYDKIWQSLSSKPDPDLDRRDFYFCVENRNKSTIFLKILNRSKKFKKYFKSIFISNFRSSQNPDTNLAIIYMMCVSIVMEINGSIDTAMDTNRNKS